MKIDRAMGLLKMAVPMRAVTMSEFNDFIEAVNMAIYALENLPSAEPRKKGKWIIDGHHIICNRCKNSMCDRDREGDLIPKNYCSNCGCQMREGEQDE